MSNEFKESIRTFIWDRCVILFGILVDHNHDRKLENYDFEEDTDTHGDNSKSLQPP